MKYRIESDIIGNLEIPKTALFGINAARAKANFPFSKQFNLNWYKAIANVKHSYYLVYEKFKNSALNKFSSDIYPFFDAKIISALQSSAIELSQGKYFDYFIVSAISGGAGTSINMNINEIIANVALNKLGKDYGEYQFCSPLDHANIFQSTNDVIPSALKIAAMQLLNKLEEVINLSRTQTESLEIKFRNHLRIGYTQMQSAVPTSYGRLFSTFSEALSRDWWRVSKAFERLKNLNLGGSAIGTSLGVPRYFLVELVPILQEITSLPISRAENLSDATSNLDSLVEVHAILKAHAVNLEKIASDIRLLASDLSGNQIIIQQMQQGSSIMPGKINPVISEYIISCSHKVYANDTIITNLSAQGNLELNAYLPLIGDTFLESIELLISCNEALSKNLLDGIAINNDEINKSILANPAISTILIPFIGYKNSEKIAKEMIESKCDILEANSKLNLISENKLKELIKPGNILKQGFSLNDL